MCLRVSQHFQLRPKEKCRNAGKIIGLQWHTDTSRDAISVVGGLQRFKARVIRRSQNLFGSGRLVTGQRKFGEHDDLRTVSNSDGSQRYMPVEIVFTVTNLWSSLGNGESLNRVVLGDGKVVTHLERHRSDARAGVFPPGQPRGRDQTGPGAPCGCSPGVGSRR